MTAFFAQVFRICAVDFTLGIW